MAIVSAGYAGTVTDVQWARMVPRVGAAVVGVDDYASFRVTAAAGTRTVRVAAGVASGHGVQDVSDAAVNVVLGDVTSGVRWDLIVLRRNWSTKTTTVVAIPGGGSKALPSRNTNVGVLADQPLALVRVAAGSTNIQEIADLRVSAVNGGVVGWDDLTRSYLTDLGTVIRIGNTVWYRTTNTAGNPMWMYDSIPDASAARTWLTKHVNGAPSTGRAYFGTDEKGTENSATYIGMSPVAAGTDNAQTEAFWFTTSAGTRFAILKNGDIRVVGRINAPHAPWATAAGVRTGVNSTFTQLIPFPTGRFTVPPIVTAQPVGGRSEDLGKYVMVSNVTSGGFLVRHGLETGTITVHWQAIQMTANSAAG